MAVEHARGMDDLIGILPLVRLLARAAVTSIHIRTRAIVTPINTSRH
jgi:hypothetical protein